MTIIKAITKAHLWNEQLLSGEVKLIEDIAKQENIKSPSYVTRILRLKFLAPEITESILAGTQPRHLTCEQLLKVATIGDWGRQVEMVGM